MSKIILTDAWFGAVDGIHAINYPAGAEVDFPARIADVLLEDGRAIPAGQEAKATDGDPENKAMDLNPENKQAPPRRGRPPKNRG